MMTETPWYILPLPDWLGKVESLIFRAYYRGTPYLFAGEMQEFVTQYQGVTDTGCTFKLQENNLAPEMLNYTAEVCCPCPPLVAPAACAWFTVRVSPTGGAYLSLESEGLDYTSSPTLQSVLQQFITGLAQRDQLTPDPSRQRLR